MADLGEQARDDAYRAIGRYVVEFSHLVFVMRFMLITRSCNPEDGTVLLELALGDATAVQIANGFFAVCQEVAQLDGIEKKISRALRARVLGEIELRNNVAHGDWFIEGEQDLDGATVLAAPSTLIRVKPAAKDSAAHIQDLNANTMDKWSEGLKDLTLMIIRFGEITLSDSPASRVSDAFAFKDKQIIWAVEP